MAGFAIPLLVSGLGALAGAFGGSQQTSDTNAQTSTTPNFTPQQSSLIGTLSNAYEGLLTPSSLANFGSAYTTAGTKNIQTGANLAEQAANDALAARGIANTTAGAEGVSNTSQSESGNLSTFLNQAPLLLDQRNQALLSNAAGFEASLPVGTNVTSNSHTVGTGGPTSPLQGALVGGGSTLAGVLGQQYANNSLANILKSIGSPVSVPSNSSNVSYTIPAGSTAETASEDNGGDNYGPDF